MTARDHVDWDREADADVAAGARDDRGVDADELAVQVDERAAGVAGIDRRVGLNEVLERLLLRPLRPSALTMPDVTVFEKPNGLPIATT